jgi:hypothetical protein
VDGAGYVQTFVVIIHLVTRAVSCAKSAGGAVICIDIPWTLNYIRFEITWCSLKG